MMEFQITQEYLGHGTHLVYLGELFKEVLDAETHANGAGSSVASVLDGSLHRYSVTGMAGVANTGTDRNWTSHHFGQANWYAYGRLAWNPDLAAEDIADDWIAMTWGHASAVRSTARSLMLDSHQTYVDYTMPLGLHHLIGGDHYAPMPENPDPRRADEDQRLHRQPPLPVGDPLGVGLPALVVGVAVVEAALDAGVEVPPALVAGRVAHDPRLRIERGSAVDAATHEDLRFQPIEPGPGHDQGSARVPGDPFRSGSRLDNRPRGTGRCSLRTSFSMPDSTRETPHERKHPGHRRMGGGRRGG